MTPLFKKFLGMNWFIVLNLAGLIVFGVYAIFNASAYNDSPALALKWRDQIRWVMIGLPFFFGASLLDYKWVRWACVPMYIVGIVLLLLLKTFGVTIQGNTNW